MGALSYVIVVVGTRYYCYFCVMWFQLPTAVLQLQKNASL